VLGLDLGEQTLNAKGAGLHGHLVLSYEKSRDFLARVTLDSTLGAGSVLSAVLATVEECRRALDAALRHVAVQ
jgi:hypothetical protein